MASADFVLLILNCKRYKEKAEKQRRTWLRDFTLMPYYHVIGEPQLSTPFLFNEEDRILYVRCADDYVSLPKKVIAAYAAVQRTYQFKYIFKTDDDQILCDASFLPRLCTQLTHPQRSDAEVQTLIALATPQVGSLRTNGLMLASSSPTSSSSSSSVRQQRIHYGGFKVSIVRPHVSQYCRIHPELPKNIVMQPTHYCSGRFYFLSNLAVAYLVGTKAAEVCREWFEDYAIGLHLAPVFKANMLHLPTNDYFTDIA